MIDVDRPHLVAQLDKFDTEDSSHDITVGLEWDSPFGLTGPVAGVAVPHNSHNPNGEVTERPADSHSQTVAARKRLDAIVDRKF
jgi:hypothetical protein